MVFVWHPCSSPLLLNILCDSYKKYIARVFQLNLRTSAFLEESKSVHEH